jgi:Ca2+-binding EF-hand superfamily protein
LLRVWRVFVSADVDGSGDVELDELLASPEWRKMYTADRIRDMFEAMDLDASGRVTADELFRGAFPLADRAIIRAMVKWARQRSDEEAAKLPQARVLTRDQRDEALLFFSSTDRNSDGKVTVADLRDMLDASCGAGAGGSAATRHDSKTPSGRPGSQGTAGLKPAEGWGLEDAVRIITEHARDDAVLVSRDDFITLVGDIAGSRVA